MKLTINGIVQTLPDEWRDEPLLYVLREALGLVGAKFGCGLGQCGACTVIIDGQARMAEAMTADQVTDTMLLSDLQRTADILDDFKRASTGLHFDPMSKPIRIL